MNTRHLHQTGFGLVAVFLVLVIIGAVGGAGYYIFSKTNSKQPAKISEINSYDECINAGYPVLESYPEQCSAHGKTFINPSYQANKLSLADDKVTMYVPEGWKAVPEKNFNSTTAVCGQSVTSDELCVDLSYVVLEKEGFTSSDQFLIRIGVFKRQSTSPAIDWFNNELDAGIEVDHQLTEMKINGFNALHYTVNYGDKETRVKYAVTNGNYGVLISANAFSGDYYSFINKTKTDYRIYLPIVEQIAKSVSIR